MRVTSPAGWAAFLACSVLIAIAVIWGCYGTVPTKVSGRGILIEKESLFDVVAVGEGQVLEVIPEVGDVIKSGQLIARVSQPELTHRVEKARRTLDHLLEEQAVITKLGSEIHSSREQHLNQRRKMLLESIHLSESHINDLYERITLYKELVEDGTIARKTYLDTKAEYNKEMEEVLKFREQLSALPTSSFKATSEQKKEQIDVELRIIKAEEELDSEKDKLNIASQIISPKTGKVNEIFKSPGSYLKTGQALLNIETDSPDNNFYISAYFAPEKGKRIQKGMSMLISPSVAKREEYGVMLGEVVSVSSFPASPRGMMNILDNQRLVELLTKDGPPIRVRARILKDPTSFSGFKWSSGKGAPVILQSGTMCTADVVVEEQKPISLVLPYLKKTVLGIGETYQ